jgi:hypothetical protein
VTSWFRSAEKKARAEELAQEKLDREKAARYQEQAMKSVRETQRKRRDVQAAQTLQALWQAVTLEDIIKVEKEWEEALYSFWAIGSDYNQDNIVREIVDKKKRYKKQLIMKLLVLIDQQGSEIINIDFLAGLLVGELLYDKDPDLKWLAKKLLVVTNERKTL